MPVDFRAPHSVHTRTHMRHILTAFEALILTAFAWTAIATTLLPFIAIGSHASAERLNAGIGAIALIASGLIVLGELWLVWAIHRRKSKARGWLVARAILFVAYLILLPADATPFLWSIAGCLLLESVAYVLFWPQMAEGATLPDPAGLNEGR